MRVAEAEVARVLLAIETEPNRRARPLPGDLEGSFDYWFDGGAVSMVSQNIRYLFLDGTTAFRGISPHRLSVTIVFPGGETVKITQA